MYPIFLIIDIFIIVAYCRNKISTSNFTIVGKHSPAFTKCVAEIVSALINTYKEGKKVNVSKLKSDEAAKHHLSEQPKTVDVIAAIPDSYRSVLLPILKTKPVRTASGVRI